MKWFKFYGQDYLTDPKMIRLSLPDRQCFITLLCLASGADEGGRIRNCDEETLIHLTHLSGENYDMAKGCLKRYEALHCVTLHDNGDVTVVNFGRRQGENLSNAERQKNYRERQKKPINKVIHPVTKRNERNVTQSNDSNARVEENRIDKIRVKTEDTLTLGEFKNISLSEEELQKLTMALGENNTNALIAELSSYMASSGKRYKSHYATLQNWARRKFQEQRQLTKKGKGII